MNVETIINDVIRREGGYINHPNDKGGPTKYGITLRTLESYLDRKCTIDDIRNLSKELAVDIYEEKYFRFPKIDRLPQEIQPFMLDSAVNHGPDDPILFVQRVCNAVLDVGLSVDGVAGPATRMAARDCQELMGDYFLKALIEERRNKYRQIVSNDPSQQVFFDGWMNRMAEFE